MALNTGQMRMDVPHLQNSILKRGVSMRQVLEVIRNGAPINDPQLDRYGDWKLTLSRKVAGKRVQVIVAVTESYFVAVSVI